MRVVALAQVPTGARLDVIPPQPLAFAPLGSYPLLVLPGDATQAGVELQVLLGCQLIKEGIKLGAVAQALLDLQELLQDAAEESRGATAKRNCCSEVPQGSPHFHTL